MLHTLIRSLEKVSGNTLAADAAEVIKTSGEFRRFALAALDPAVTYGQKGNLKHGYGLLPFGEEAYLLLSRLSSRELTGNAAKQALTDFCLLHTQEAVDLMNRALNKDLRCGVGTTLINKLKGQTGFYIPVFEVALAQPAEAKRLKKGRWVQALKYDGMRTLIDVNDNRVSFWTRSGKAIPALQPFDKLVLEVFGGHKLMLDSEGVGKSFLETVSQLRRKAADADVTKTTDLMLFDILDRDTFYARMGRDEPFGESLEKRLERLDSFLQGEHGSLRVVEHHAVTDWEQAKQRSDEWIEQGHEGSILRNLDARYTKARTHDWLKTKLEDAKTVRIIGVYEGEMGKKYEGMLGGARVVLDGVESDVGGGWSDWERAAIWAAETGEKVRLNYIDVDGLASSEIINPDPANKIVGRLIDVLFNGTMPSGAMRHARKLRFRDVDGEIA